MVKIWGVWVGYNLLKYLFFERRNLVMNDIYCEFDIEVSLYKKCLSLFIFSLVREGCYLKKKMF